MQHVGMLGNRVGRSAAQTHPKPEGGESVEGLLRELLREKEESNKKQEEASKGSEVAECDKGQASLLGFERAKMATRSRAFGLGRWMRVLTINQPLWCGGGGLPAVGGRLSSSDTCRKGAWISRGPQAMQREGMLGNRVGSSVAQTHPKPEGGESVEGLLRELLREKEESNKKQEEASKALLLEKEEASKK
eukprot:CAMPEP_0173416694 /NCGR_PEP_ID=MMETSP1356-20130122/85514_1 /TAXON_ID=77927 ORGANISM="Hemiselmis virescens, Strain PCC157" /NCGR_SAMPLE_ID=MMETSP1356 /ASSEMBLY_ACC=CAM_ASM_000847 /LENGTH=190 /DNA_ID=CAMNT_0014379009 /DNA_START=524 /DNA_END=1094 /DNA_ORIENTATION=+